MQGTGSLYVAKLTRSDDDLEFLTMSGWFKEAVGESILVTNGRFDFKVKSMGL